MYFSFVYLKSWHVCSLKFTKKKRQLWIFIHLRPFFFFEITKVWLCSFTCCKIKVFIKMFFFNKYGKNKKYWRYKWWWFFSLFFCLFLMMLTFSCLDGLRCLGFFWFTQIMDLVIIHQKLHSLIFISHPKFYHLNDV